MTLSARQGHLHEPSSFAFLERENRRLRAALVFYADEKNWWNVNADDQLRYHNADLGGSMESLLARVGVIEQLPNDAHPQFFNDCGRRAREALTGTR